MKAIGSFIIVLFIICVCFVKCTSDRTKVRVYSAMDYCLQNQIYECNKRIAEEKKAQADTINVETLTNKRPVHRN